ncbi:MAG: Cna B-type domain-containing protein, partial [Firmicutes bacterium]|nr:Cna B-type domain-containing protein [Bacillota bacterium]
MNNQLWASAGRSRPKRLLTVLMCLLLTVMMMPVAAAAQLQDEEGGSKSLQLIFKDGELALSGVRFDFYQISGKASETESEAQNAQSGSQDRAEEAAAAFVQAQGIQPVFSGTTDENGQLLVPELKAGSYLISGEEKTLDHVKYVPQKSVVNLEAAGTVDDAGGTDPVVVSVKFTKEAAQQDAAPDAQKSGDSDPAEKNRSDNSGESGADADSNPADDPDDQPAEVTKMDSSDASAEKVTIAVDKIWVHDGNSASAKPDQATVNLKGSDGTELKETISGNGSCSFKDLPVTDKDGKTITYTITETAVADYATAMASGSKTTSEAIAKAQESAVKANADTVITAVKAATDNQITLTKDQAELLLS